MLNIFKFVCGIILHYSVLLCIAPLIYAFEIFFVLPKVRDIILAGPLKQCIHICISTWLLINICGNILMNVWSKLGVTECVAENDGVYCEVCETWRPMNSWHCKHCKACILKRDHHCNFFNRCIGHGNRRFYILFLGHASVSMAYASYYNYYWVASGYEDAYGPLITVFRFMNPLARYLIMHNGGQKEICVAYWFANLATSVWAGGLFLHHLWNALHGVTTYEAKHYPTLKNRKNWKQNLLNVFGIKWYWAIVWPFCSSPLPQNYKTEKTC